MVNSKKLIYLIVRSTRFTYVSSFSADCVTFVFMFVLCRETVFIVLIDEMHFFFKAVSSLFIGVPVILESP
jgi:hypothetical protein